MAAPRFAPVPEEDIRAYESPDHVPEPWTSSRPAEIVGRQPRGERLGYQGPDQGYVLTLASRLRPHVRVTAGESVDDALRGCTLIALKRASLFGRAPVIGDLRLALTIWGFLDVPPGADQLSARKVIFEGVRNVVHHYAEGRVIADMVPESTLRLTPEQAAARMPDGWRALVGA